ncbi:hypothetical protein TSAR_006785 [Trichomalopsis sarcophagae]|uniref:Uncharacterized protein n=1 Tax=Trichomalopsis sarcophagae TaxID=543379 RepID=A0A232FN44_9HYME|nr:hypothetical protein TSAR_006785 [Trichomalopsis sarcophagae]
MDLVIDFLFSKDNKGRVVSKEVGLLLTLHRHGLDWYDRDVSLNKFYNTMHDICRKANKIYVRGEEKAKRPNKITTRERRRTSVYLTTNCHTEHGIVCSILFNAAHSNTLGVNTLTSKSLHRSPKCLDKPKTPWISREEEEVLSKVPRKIRGT